MELRHLRYFVAVASAGSFTRAAIRLGITQPALSRQVHDLEADLGVTLFARVKEGIRLTSDGEELLRDSVDLLGAAERLSARAKQPRGGTLRVVAGAQTMESVLAPFLAQYLKAWPDVEVLLMEANGGHLGRLVERGDAHVGIGVFRRGEPLETCPLFPVRLLAVEAATRRRTRRGTLELGALDDQRVLVFRRGFMMRALFDQACRAARVTPRTAVEAGDAQSLVALAEAGAGIAVVASTTLYARRRVHAVPIVHDGASLGTWAEAAWHAGRALPAFAAQFVDELRDRTGRIYPAQELDVRTPPVPRRIA